jgi:valyl-tRNA synthetase
VVEPYLTDQWFVDAATLAKPAIAAVEDGRTVLEPAAWSKTYFEWMRNIEPWCVSRQLWWGHRIPAWYGPDGAVFVEETEAEALAAAKAHYGADTALRQDEDVLDTWFSSGLWPFSTLGWPDETADLQRFYPTHTLVTGFDIIFYWVARMMMLGLHFTGEVPFRRVFFNALVRDASGKKMSKSKGNVMDPLDLIDTYGADALRFTLTAMSGQGRDIKLSTQRIEGYRNFGTKLWNAARFCQVNGCVRAEGFDPATVKGAVNRWIVGETARTAAAVTASISDCGFDEAAGLLYRFIWNTFCDWYVELSKPVLNGEDADAQAETRATAAWVMDVILKLLHPVMPFLTEELWDQTADLGAARAEPLLIAARWPDLSALAPDPAAAAEVGLVIAAIAEGRSVRSELNVPLGARPSLLVVEADAAQSAILAASGSIPFVVQGATLALPVAEFIDLAAEKARLAKEVAALAATAEQTRRKLDNPDFVARAPEEVVEENRERLADAEAARERLQAALARLS